MLLHYLGKLKNQKFALRMHRHVKHVSSVIFIICPRDICQMWNVVKISAKINTMQNINILLFVRSLSLNEHLIVVWSNFRQDIIDTAINQCRKRLQACVRDSVQMVDIWALFVNKLLQTICIFMCFWIKCFCPSYQIFTVLMLDGR